MKEDCISLRKEIAYLNSKGDLKDIIKGNPTTVKIKAIIEIKSPKNLKKEQRLTGRVDALNRFISRSCDKCHLFYNVLKKTKGSIGRRITNMHYKL